MWLNPTLFHRFRRGSLPPLGIPKLVLQLISDFLDLYQLSEYYGVDDAFLSFRVLEEFAVKITNSMIQDMQDMIGTEIEDDQLPMRVVQYFRLRQKVLESGPGWFREAEEHSAMVRQEEQHSVVVGSIVTRFVEADERSAYVASEDEEELSPPGRCTFMQCDQVESHLPTECKYFMSLSVSQRRKEVMKKMRCFLCLARGHNAKTCIASEQVKDSVKELVGLSFDPGKQPAVRAGIQ